MDIQDEKGLLQLPFVKHPNNYQPNLITESRQQFTELEKRIVVLAVNQLNQIKKNWQPGQSLIFLIPYSELTERNHKAIALAALSLGDKKIVHINFGNRALEFDKVTPFPSVRSRKIDGKSFIELAMWAEVVPAFIELGQRYTKYDLQIMLSLGSVYAQRMYEICMMYHGRHQMSFTYQVDYLRMLLNYPEGLDYYSFKQKALLTAQKELLQKAGLVFDFQPSKKQGKSVTELKFEIKSVRQIADEAVERQMAEIASLEHHQLLAAANKAIQEYSFTKEQQQRIVEEPELLGKFAKLDLEFTAGKRPKIKDKTAYIAKCLGFADTEKPVRKVSNQLPIDLVPTRTATPSKLGGLIGSALSGFKVESE